MYIVTERYNVSAVLNKIQSVSSGAFLLPYVIFAAFCGLPLLFQEIVMGQYTKCGGIGAWMMVPISQVGIFE